MPTEILKSYLAGYFDGEGCVYITSKISRHRLEVSITSTDVAPLKLLKDIYGGFLCSRGPRDGNKNQWNWQLRDQRAGKFIEDILPYSIIKAPQLHLGLEYLDRAHNPGKRKITPEQWEERASYKLAMKELKSIPVTEVH